LVSRSAGSFKERRPARRPSLTEPAGRAQNPHFYRPPAARRWKETLPGRDGKF
jgi:hypothetical protein